VPAPHRDRRRSGISELRRSTFPSVSPLVPRRGYATARRLSRPAHDGPNRPEELARDRRHGDRRAFAVTDEVAIAPMQALLRHRPTLGRALAGRSQGQPPAIVAQAWRAMVPGGLDEHASGVSVVGLW
jgi:hypothetical protein